MEEQRCCGSLRDLAFRQNLTTPLITMNLLELCMVSQVALVVPPVIYGIASLFTMSDTVKVKAVIVWDSHTKSAQPHQTNEMLRRIYAFHASNAVSPFWPPRRDAYFSCRSVSVDSRGCISIKKSKRKIWPNPEFGES